MNKAKRIIRNKKLPVTWGGNAGKKERIYYITQKRWRKTTWGRYDPPENTSKDTN
jgi:hypothetical protein